MLHKKVIKIKDTYNGFNKADSEYINCSLEHFNKYLKTTDKTEFKKEILNIKIGDFVKVPLRKNFYWGIINSIFSTKTSSTNPVVELYLTILSPSVKSSALVN